MSTPSSKTISSNSALPIPCSTAPSSWRSTSCGLIALPTSAIVAICSTLDAAGLGVDGDLGGADADLPEDRALGVGAAALLGAHLALADELAADEAEVLGDQLGVAGLVARAAHDPVGDLEPGPLDAPGAGRDLQQALAQVGGGALHGEAGERRRAARAGRAVVGGEAGVGALHRDPVDVDRQLLGGDLGEHRARPLAHLGGADVDLDAAVGLHAHDGARDRVRAGGEQPDREPAPGPLALRLSPADRGRRLLDVADQVGVERLAAPSGRTGSPGRSRLRRRISSGSIPARRASSSTCNSPIHCRCAAPKAR